MASKSKLELRRLEKQKKLWRKNRFILGFSLFLLVTGAFGLSVWLKSGPTPEMEGDIAQSRFQAELSTLATENSISQRFPVVLRQRLQSMIELNRAGKLGIEINTNHNLGNQYAVMGCECDTTEPPKIVVFAPWFNSIATREKPEEFRVMFAILLYHELIHLERWPITKPQTSVEDLEEEIRAYSRTSLEIVRPLRTSGAWIPYDFLGIDDVLLKCNDSSQCPEFHEKIREYSPKTNKTASTSWLKRSFFLNIQINNHKI